MFKCFFCGGQRVDDLVATVKFVRVICANCGREQQTQIRVAATESEVGTEVEVEEAEPMEEEELSWLGDEPSLEERGYPPELGPVEPAYSVGGSPQLFRSNLSRLWWNGWEQLGQYLGSELYDELARPIIEQMVDTPEYVEKLYRPHGGTYLTREFVDTLRSQVSFELEQRGLAPQVRGGKFRFPRRYVEEGKVVLEMEPELGDWVYGEFIPQFESKYRHLPQYRAVAPKEVEEKGPGLDVFVGELLRGVVDWERGG
jgi:hypothetical protein